MADLTHTNATIEGCILLDEKEGIGTSEHWLSIHLSQGGIVCATPWLLFIGHPKTGEPRTLHVGYTYGDNAPLADFVETLLPYFDYVEFTRFNSDRPRRYPAPKLVHYLRRQCHSTQRNRASLPLS